MMYIMAFSNYNLTIAAWCGVAVVKFCAINCSSSRTVQNVLKNSIYDADARKLLNDLGWQKLETQWLIHKAVMVYRSLNCLAPYNQSLKFILRSDIFNSYYLNKFSVPLPRINYSFCYSGAVLWNNFPSNARQ